MLCLKIQWLIRRRTTMKIYSWNQVPVERMTDAVTRQVIHTDSMSIARLHLRKGALVPRHSHPNEQVSTVEAGSLRFIFDDEEAVVRTGESMQIPGDVPHAVEALEDAIALDLFSPCRADWISGDDAYLRGR
jgi:quercetin dioxygenase-like cupin family protein